MSNTLLLLHLNLVFILSLSVNAQFGPCDIQYTRHPMSQEVSIGQNVSLFCELNDTYIHRDFVHYLPNGSVWDIEDNNRRHLERGFERKQDSGNVPNELLIFNVRPFHAGYYACRAVSNKMCTLVSVNATVTIIGPPVLQADNTFFSGDTGGEAEISVSVAGSSPLNAQLFKLMDSENLVEVTPDSHPQIHSTFINSIFRLVVRDLHVKDGGTYRIQATNSYGTSQLDVMLRTIGPDKPVVVLPNIAVSNLNARLEVTCSVQDEAKVPSVTFKWTDESNRILTDTPTTQIMSDTFTSTLIFPSFTRNQTGTYACTATNSRVPGIGFVKIFSPPVPPIPSVLEGVGKQRTIRWDRPTTSDPDEPILQYQIILYRLNEGNNLVSTDQVNVSGSHDLNSYTFTNLNGGSYGVTITSISIANGQYFKGQPSTSISFTIGDDSITIIAIAVGSVAGIAVLVAVGAACGIFFLCVYYPHKQKFRSQQQTWSREDVKTDSAIPNQYTALHPNSDLPLSPTTSPISSLMSTDIDPKWEFPRENITLCEVLCEGQFTILYRGVAKTIKDKPMDVAIKSVRDDATEDDQKALVAEIEMLSSIGPHPNIVSMMRVCTVGKPLYIVMEYMCHGDLLGFLRSVRGHQEMYTVSPGLHYQPPVINLCPRDLLNIGAKIANGMRYLADRKIVHRALCAKNVLVGPSMDIKINNVGSFDMVFENGDYLMKWMAPETLFDQTATTYSDVWSFGVTLWELVTVGGTPYGEIESENLYSQLHSGMRMPCPHHCAEEIHDVMLECWQGNPLNRPHFAVIHEKLEQLATSKMSLLDLQNYDGDVYTQFEEPAQLSTAL